MITIQFSYDMEGYFKAESEPQYLLLSQYFESEIQGVAIICHDLLTMIKEIETGDRLEIEGIGNGHGLKLTSEKAIIWNEFTDTKAKLEISLDDFKQALKNCLNFLKVSS